jgi:hypothetical protein
MQAPVLMNRVVSHFKEHEIHSRSGMACIHQIVWSFDKGTKICSDVLTQCVGGILMRCIWSCG